MQTRLWRASEVIALRKWDRVGCSPGYVSNRVQHSVEDCDLMRWMAVGRTPLDAALTFNELTRG